MTESQSPPVQSPPVQSPPVQSPPSAAFRLIKLTSIPVVSWHLALAATIAGVTIAGVTLAEETIVCENAQPGVKYVGTQQCIDCHRDQHASYLNTTHSVATTKTDPDSEPASEEFEHALSGHRYEIERKDGDLIHREILRDADGKKISATEQVIAYSVGSGTHGKSYLFQSGDFVAQSPLTWYRDTGSWHMSPGYDTAIHKSFRRKITTECLFCHVGSIDQKEHNPYQFEIMETTIGCERCHGPGELHVAKYQHDPDATGADNTIVNPGKLERRLSQAICQQCHLQGACMATVSGKQEWDYRPGLPLTDFRIDYQYRLGNEQMRIVGHVEQMHESVCYQQTETLTCTTCHDPHHPVAAENRIDFYRATCLKCHEDQSCGKSLEQRMQLADNNCYQCHMPKADTNVAHAAFHHHRIGIHTKDDDASTEAIKGLTPVLDVSALSQRQRSEVPSRCDGQLDTKAAGSPGVARLCDGGNRFADPAKTNGATRCSGQ